MTILDSEVRIIFQKIMNQYPTIANFTKTDMKDAINAVDAWIDANAVSFNNVLPTLIKNNLTTQQKYRLLKFILEIKYG